MLQIIPPQTRSALYWGDRHQYVLCYSTIGSGLPRHLRGKQLVAMPGSPSL
jgi:hypothetical protein